MLQKLVTVTVPLNGPTVQTHLEQYLSQGWRIVSVSVAAAGGSYGPHGTGERPGPGVPRAVPADAAVSNAPTETAAICACLAVVLERDESLYEAEPPERPIIVGPSPVGGPKVRTPPTAARPVPAGLKPPSNPLS